jgi:dTDP-4-amino-4,6-dideoxygalactose transaminase
MSTARRLHCALVLLAALASSPAVQAQGVAVKLATVVPENSIWDKNLKQMAADWKQSTGDRVVVTIFSGGSQGDENSVLRKMRLDTLQAAVLLVKLAHLDKWTRQRQENARHYDAAFGGLVGKGKLMSIPKTIDGYRHIYNQYVLRVRDRDGLKNFLASKGIGTEVYYPVSLHMQECFRYLEYRPEDCKEAMQASRETLAIPIYPELSADQREHVVDSVREFCG